MKANIKKNSYKKKLTIRQDWYCKSKNEITYKLKRWGNKRIMSGKVGCSNDQPSAPVFIPRTKGGSLAAKIRDVENKLNQLGERRRGKMSSRHSS